MGMTTLPIGVAAPQPEAVDTMDPRVRALLAAIQQNQGVAAPPTAPTAAPGQVDPIATPAMGNVAPVAAPAPPPQPSETPTPAAKGPGALKGFLSNFLYGGGQAMLQHVGLPTDYEKKQNADKLLLAQQAANDTSAYRQAQIGGLEARAASADAGNQPYTFGSDESVPAQLRGQTFPAAVAAGLQKVLAQNTGKTAAAQISATSRDHATDVKSDTAKSLGVLNSNTRISTAQLAAQVHRDIASGNQGLAAARLQLAQQKFRTAQSGGGNGAPTTARLNKADLANNAQYNLGEVIDKVQQNPNLFGKVAGHFTTVEQMMGSDDPAISEIANHIHAAAMASNGVHGVRGAQLVKDTEDQFLNHFRNSPEATIAGMKATSDSLGQFVNFANYGKQNAPSSKSAPTTTKGAAASNFFSKFGGKAD